MDPLSSRSKPRVFCSYSVKDAKLYRKLAKHLDALARTGLVQVLQISPGTLRVDEIELWNPESSEQPEAADNPLEKADLLLLLLSADYLAADRFPAMAEWVLLRERRDRIKVIPVYLRPCNWEDSELGGHHVVPTKAVTMWQRQEEAWQEVVQEIRRCVLPIEDIFKTSGQPDISFVEPSQLPDLVDHLRNMGRGLVVEGPSGIGKTTAVQHALARAIPSIRPHPPLTWLDGKKKTDVIRLRHILDDNFQKGGHLVIDDFHRLELSLQKEAASLIKIVSDDNRRDAKVTLIGINRVGVSLVQGFHDLVGRFAPVYMGRQPNEKIDELIGKGQAAANVEFRQRQNFVKTAAGSFFTAQLLCYQACLREGIREIQKEKRYVETGPAGYVTDRVQQELASKYYDTLCAFASLDERSPPRGGCLVLLWLLHQSPDQSVSLQIARNRYPLLATVFDWLMAGNLWSRLQQDTSLAQRFYCRRDAGVLSADDPQLGFYLSNLNWEAFIRDTGHVAVGWDPIDGPQFDNSLPSVDLVKPASPLSLPDSYVLHLSDLHFGSMEQASLWSEQLLQDLKSDVCPPRIDVVVLSGDIANRATVPEYQAATKFLLRLQDELGLSPQQLVLVPGNHDVSWEQSRKAYAPVRRTDHKGPLEEGRFIDGGAYVEIRNEEEYAKRFAEFSNFYHRLRLEHYPLDYEQQTTLHYFSSQQLLFLGMNSAWALDHHYRTRAGIHQVALGEALRLVRTTAAYTSCLKLAVWHHPLSSGEEDRIKDSGFIELLAQAGFRLVLHGHIHKAQTSEYRYERQASGRRIDILSAGTFGAPVRQWVPGYPLQYQLLKLSRNKLRVFTRSRRELLGAWGPDASWLQGAGVSPLPYYDVDL